MRDCLCCCSFTDTKTTLHTSKRIQEYSLEVRKSPPNPGSGAVKEREPQHNDMGSIPAKKMLYLHAGGWWIVYQLGW